MRHAAWVLVGALVWSSSEATRAQTALQELENKIRTANQQGQLPGQQPGGPATVVAPSAAPAVEPGFLGLLADDQARGGGVRIVELTVGAPGEKAGLKAGDVVTAIDGRPITTMRDFEPIMLGTQAGAKLTFQVLRDNQPQQIVVTLGQRPTPAERRFDFGRIPEDPATPPEARAAVLGVRLATVTPEIQRAYSLPAPRGALVVDVVPGSPAAKAGVPVEAVVVFVDGKQIDTPSDLSRLVAEAGPGKEIKLAYFSRGQLVERKVRLESRFVDPLAVDPMIVARPQVESDQVPALQRRILELEKRVAELEAALKRQP